MGIRALWTIFEGLGVATDVANWFKLRFISGLFNKPQSQPAQTGGQNMNPVDGDKNLQDEQRTLLALCEIYAPQIQALSSDEVGRAAETLTLIFERLTSAGRPGAIEKLRQIVAFSGTTKTTRRPTGEKIDGKDVLEETKRVIPEDGKSIILGLHVMATASGARDIDLVLNRLDNMGILINSRDSLSVQGKKLSDWTKKSIEALQGSNVPVADAVVKARLTETEYALIETNLGLQQLRTAWEAIPADQINAKEASATAYLDQLHTAFTEVLAKRDQKRPTKKIVIVIILVTAVLVFFAGAAEKFLQYF